MSPIDGSLTQQEGMSLMATTQLSNDTGFKQDVQNLGRGVATLTSDVGSLAHEAVDVARSGGAEIRQGAQHAVEAAKEKFEGAKDAAAAAAHSFTNAVSRHPVASISIAAGVGLAIGLVVFRLRR